MTACSICGSNISSGDIAQGKYRKQDGQMICQKCDAVSVPRPAVKKTTTVRAAGASSPASKTASTVRTKEKRTPSYRPPSGGGMDNLTKYAMMAAGGVFLVAAIVVFVIYSKHSTEATQKLAAEKASSDAITKIKEMVSSSDNYDAIVAEIDKATEAKVFITNSADERDAIRLRSETLSKKSQGEFIKNNTDLYAQLEKSADDMNIIDDNVKKVEALAEAASGMNKDFVDKVYALSLKIHTNAVKSIQASIQDYESKNPKDLKGIVDRYSLGLGRLEEMKRQGGEVGKLAGATFKELRKAEEDRAVQFYNDVHEKIAFVSLLDSNNGPKWFHTGPVEVTFNGGEMNVKSTTGAGSKERGTVLSSKKDFWIDFDVDFEVTINKGGFVILGRYSSSQNFFQLPFETGGEGNPIVEGKTYTVHVNAVGGDVIYSVDGIDLANNKFSMPAAARSGAFGFGISPGGDITFKSIRARVVRADK